MGARGTLVVLHGFSGSKESFDEVRLERLGFSLLAPTLTGHGPEPDLSAQDFEAELSRLAAVVERSEAPRHLVGYSQGGRVALGLAVRRPELFASVIAIGAHPGLTTEEERQERRASDLRWKELLESAGLEAFAAAWQAQPLFDSQSALGPDRLRRQHEIRLAHTPEGLSHALTALGLGTMPSLWDELERVPLPVTFVVGEEDAKFKAVLSRAAERVPHGRLVCLPGAGHNPLLEAPEALFEAIRASLGAELAPTTASLTSPSLPAPNSFGAWVLACRPATLTAAAAPVLVGTSVALVSSQSVQALRSGPGLAALAGAALLQVGSNFANDVFDYEKGADTHERLGPLRAVQGGLLSPRAVRRGMFVVFGLALVVGIYLTAAVGWPIVALGVLSILSALAYTGGPYPLGYHGLGDVFVLLFFGFVAVSGTTYVHLGHVPPLALFASFAVGALATNILVVNNLRDRHTDVEAGKRTLAVRWGRRGAELEYTLLALTAYAVPLATWAAGLSGPFALLPWLSAPLALGLGRELRSLEGRALNAVLVRTARLVLVWSVLFSLGLALDFALGGNR